MPNAEHPADRTPIGDTGYNSPFAEKCGAKSKRGVGQLPDAALIEK